MGLSSTRAAFAASSLAGDWGIIPAMRSPGLVVMGVAGLLVVGYAFYMLLSPTPRPGAAGRSRGEATRDADGDAEPGGGSREGRPPRATKRATKPEPSLATTRPSAPAPTRPEPSLPLDQARKQFADYMAELDALATREAVLTSPEWVDLYKRGHEAILPLQQNLDPQVPEQARELRMAHEDLRAKLNGVDPSRPPAHPGP